MHVLHGAAGRVRGQALEEEGRGELRYVQEPGLGPGHHGGLDGLDRFVDVHVVALAQMLVQVAVLQFLGGQARNQLGPDVQVLDRHRGAVDQPQPGHVHDLRRGRHAQLAADPGARLEGGELQQPARPGPRRLRDRQGQVGRDELLGDLRRCDEHAAAVLAHQ